MDNYIEPVKDFFKKKGFSFDEKKEVKKLKTNFFELSGTRILSDSEKKSRDGKGVPKSILDELNVICCFIIKTKGKADKEEVKFWRNRYRDGMVPPEMYFVSYEGFDESALKYVERYKGIRLVLPQK